MNKTFKRKFNLPSFKNYEFRFTWLSSKKERNKYLSFFDSLISNHELTVLNDSKYICPYLICNNCKTFFGGIFKDKKIIYPHIKIIEQIIKYNLSCNDLVIKNML